MEPFIGQIMMVGFNFPPRGWALCNGALLQISQNSALFSLLGTTYGGDGRTTFGLPDLRGRVPVHTGTGPGLSPKAWGERGGSNTRSLNVANMPPHNHVANVTETLSVAVTTATASEDDPDGTVLGAGPEIFSSAAADTNMGAQSIGGNVNVDILNTGNGTSFGIEQPFLSIHFIIALVGTFPSRN